MYIRLLISPITKAAYFRDYKGVVHAEFTEFFPDSPVAIFSENNLDWLETDIEEPDFTSLARLSFVQGIFRQDKTGLRVLSCDPRFSLTNEFVSGNKYQGKTNETVTQLAINLALHHNLSKSDKQLSLLDPMAGGGTTLLWGHRYGLETVGIDINKRALETLHRHVKKYTKIERLRHTKSDGQTGHFTKKGVGKFILYEISDKKLKLVCGDSAHSPKLLSHQKFHLLVTDIPYGIQHRGADGKRSPLDNIIHCTPAWYESLKPGGAIAVIFNSYQPKRDVLVKAFEATGFKTTEFSSPHRMSESIVRDIAVFNRPHT